MIELTLEQRRAVSSEESPTVIDPDTKAAYVLVRKEVFERIQGLIYDDTKTDHAELRRLFARSFQANDWDDPRMDAYDHYDEKQKCL